MCTKWRSHSETRAFFPSCPGRTGASPRIACVCVCGRRVSANDCHVVKLIHGWNQIPNTKYYIHLSYILVPATANNIVRIVVN